MRLRVKLLGLPRGELFDAQENITPNGEVVVLLKYTAVVRELYRC